MKKITIILTLLCLLVVAQESSAQNRRYSDVMLNIEDANYGTFNVDIPYDRVEVLNNVRRERFYLILPEVMRDRKIDMWIHIIRPWSWGGTDPLRYEFGSKSAVFIFTDRGGEGIERVVFQGEVQDPGAYDIVRGRSEFINQENYEIMDYRKENPDKVLESELDLRFPGLGDFVAERNPKRIAVNYIESLSLAEGAETFTMALTDGISYTDYVQVSKALGDKYAKRMISAEHLIIDYLSRRTMSEVALYGFRGYGERGGRGGTKYDKIIPGVTTLGDIGGGSVLTKGGDTRSGDDYIIQRGDFFNDWRGGAYVLRKGETDLPWYLKKFWENDRKVRQIMRDNVRFGLTGREMCELLARKLNEAGFIYTDYQEYNKYVDEPNKMQVHLDMHGEGKGILAPRISPLGSQWQWNMKLPLFTTFAVEYMIYMNVPEWSRANNFTGHHLSAAFHDCAVITSRGMEIPCPDSSNKIQIIQ